MSQPTAPMRVAGATPFLVDSGGAKSWLFVKVETDTGLIGWGEAYTQQDRDGAMLAHLVEMGRHLVGRSPFSIKHFSSVMYLDYALRRPAMDFWSALSAIEQAMWDIVGKACGQPVYNLLGGACRERIRVYANGWSDRASTPEERAEKLGPAVLDRVRVVDHAPQDIPHGIILQTRLGEREINEVWLELAD